jgi:hypothetical protein
MEGEMNWFWMNVPLDAVFFGAWVGIPLWMVLKHPHWGPEPADSVGRKAADPEPVFADRSEQLVGASAAMAGAGRI